jgi:mandelate racemase
LILIDPRTREGVVGRSHLEPYPARSVPYLGSAIADLAGSRTGRPVRPLDDFDESRRVLNLVGHEGVAMIAVSGLDMAAWDAVAKTAEVPLARNEKETDHGDVSCPICLGVGSRDA